MSVNPSATAEMVFQFSFNSRCISSLPCKHDCRIILNDGRVFDGFLLFNEIIALINVLDADQALGARTYFLQPQHISPRNVPKCINHANTISIVNLFARMFPP